MVIAQDDRQTVFFTQVVDCLADGGLAFTADGFLFRGSAVPFANVRQRLQRLRQPHPGSAGMQAVAAHMHGDSIQPGRQGGLAAVRTQGLQGSDKDILSGFFSLRAVFQYGLCQAINRWLVFVDQALDSQRVALLAEGK